MVSWDQDDLAVMGRRDDTNIWNMALGGENSGSQCRQLWFPVGLIGSTAVQQQGDLPLGLGGHQRAQRPARCRSHSSFCCAVVSDKSLNSSGPLPPSNGDRINLYMLQVPDRATGRKC